MNNMKTIMSLMNNGLQPNPSTLKDTIPEIMKLGLQLGKVNEVSAMLEFIPAEKALNPRVGHEGIDQVVDVCKSAISPSLEQAKVR